MRALRNPKNRLLLIIACAVLYNIAVRFISAKLHLEERITTAITMLPFSILFLGYGIIIVARFITGKPVLVLNRERHGGSRMVLPKEHPFLLAFIMLTSLFLGILLLINVLTMFLMFNDIT